MRIFHPEIPEDLIAHVKELADEDEYSDNIRIYCVDTGVGSAEYGLQERSGCCGSVDRFIEWNDGKEYGIGWNYGH